MSEITKDIVEMLGNPMHMGTKYCKEFKKTHENCYGCESEMGCSKMVSLNLLSTYQIEQGTFDSYAMKICDAQNKEEIYSVMNEVDRSVPDLFGGF